MKSKIKFKVLMTVMFICATAIFAGCSSDSNEPDDSDLLQGTTWISEYDIPGFGSSARGEYLFSTSKTGTWRAKVFGVTVPFSTDPFTYNYKNKNITINFTEDGAKEVGSVNGNSMILTKDNSTVINYVKQ